MTEPILRRKFQLTSFDANSNKFYELERYPDGRLITRHGRVGVTGQTTDWGCVSDGFVQAKVSEKLRKGYQEVDLHVPTTVVNPVTNSAVDPKVERVVSQIFAEAGERISTYLATSVDALSKTQIEQGRKYLADAQHALEDKQTFQLNPSSALHFISRYYNTIPTKLPSKIDKDELVRDFNITEQNTRLDQLESALASHVITAAGGSQYSALGAELLSFTGSEPHVGFMLELLEKTLKPNRVRVKDLFAVRIPQERRAYESETFGKEQELYLFHGTRGANVRHILRSGLIVPRSYSNGWRFGAGIYLAPDAWRSYQYVSSQSAPRLLFLTLAAVGKQWVNSGSDSSMRAAPTGYHSVRGTGSWSGRGDEIILYKPSQATIVAVVTLE